MSKEKIVSIVVIVVVIAGIAGIAVYGGKKASLSKAPVAVAYVNDAPITKDAFDAQVTTALNNLKSQGVDVASSTIIAQVKVQVLNDMVNDALVSQEIAKAKIAATQQQIDAQYQTLVSQAGGTDKLASQLAAANLTDAQLRANIAKQLAVRSYLISKIDMNSATATVQEIKSYYQQAINGQKNPPALNAVAEQIRQQLIANKQQALINALLNTLRAGAKISTTTTPL